MDGAGRPRFRDVAVATTVQGHARSYEAIGRERARRAMPGGSVRRPSTRRLPAAKGKANG